MAKTHSQSLRKGNGKNGAVASPLRSNPLATPNMNITTLMQHNNNVINSPSKPKKVSSSTIEPEEDWASRSLQADLKNCPNFESPNKSATASYARSLIPAFFRLPNRE